MATILPQHYRSIVEFANANRLPISTRQQGWRLVNPVHGEIHGIPGSHGVLIATDGILCYIERPHHDLFLGHIEWFEPLKHDNHAPAAASTPRKTPKLTRVLEEYA